MIQPVSVSRVSTAGHIQPSYTTPVLRRNRTSAAPPNAHLPSPKPFVRCPVCNVESRRLQETKRHLLLHLPCWIVCSFDGCTWRGYRPDNFRKHLYDEHQSQSTGLDKHGYQLYDPWPLVAGIIGGSVSIGDAESWAITRIKNIALELDRQELLMDPWGRKGKNLKGSRHYSRFAERTNALPITSSTPASSSVPPAKLQA